MSGNTTFLKDGIMSRGEVYFSEGQLKGVLEMQILT